MRETGDEFDAESTAAPGTRYRIRPVLRYGRAIPGRRPQLRSWSVWSYILADHPEIDAIPAASCAKDERPRRFTCRFGTGPAAREVELTLVDEARILLQRAA